MGEFLKNKLNAQNVKTNPKNHKGKDKFNA